MNAAETSEALGLADVAKTRYQIVQCTAKTLAGQDADPAVQKGLKWLMQQIDSDYTKLSTRVEKQARDQV